MWNSIDTAPKNGTNILVACRNDVYIVRWEQDWSKINSDYHWCCPDTDLDGEYDENSGTITYHYSFIPEKNILGWMPLPELPKKKDSV